MSSIARLFIINITINFSFLNKKLLYHVYNCISFDASNLEFIPLNILFSFKTLLFIYSIFPLFLTFLIRWTCQLRKFSHGYLILSLT